MNAEALFASKVLTSDHQNMTVAKDRLMRALRSNMPNVQVETLEAQAGSYRTYKADFERCAEACIDFIADYAGIVRGIGNDETAVDKQALKDAVADWMSDELSTADDWADEVEGGMAAA